MVDTEHTSRRDVLGKLWFLIDIPLFIDEKSISQLFDAMVRPEWQPMSRISTDSKGESLSAGLGVAVEGEGSIPFFLKGKARTSAKADATTKTDNSRATSEQSNISAEMNLEKIVNHYVKHFPERVLILSDSEDRFEDFAGNALEWTDCDKLLDAPGMRPLVVLDLPPNTKILPMFAETTSGAAIELHKDLAKRLEISASLPPLPSRKDPDYETGAIAHWNRFAESFRSMEAIRCVEAVKHRLHWIAFRLWPGGTAGALPVHLSILPCGNYANGTFAYQFIRRTEHFGIRLIGTLKKGKDINVLGIYER